MTLTYRSMLLLGTALAAALAGTSAHAQSQTKSTYLSPLTISSGDEDGIGDPYSEPKTESTVSADEIAQFGGKNTDDVLRSQPGTFTRDSPQNPGIAVNIRGMEGSGRVNMSIDGARQNFRFTGHEAQGFTYVDAALLTGIDIQRGAVMGVGGAGALAGVANFRTLAVDDILSEGKNFGGFASLTFGTNGAGFAEAGAAAYRFNEHFAVLGAISKRNPADYENGDGEVVPFTAQDIISGLGKVEITPTEDMKITLGGLVYNDEFTANSYDQTVNNQTYTARLDYTPIDNELIDLHALIYKNETKMTYGKHISLPSGGSAQGRVIDDNGWGVSLYNTSRGELGDIGVVSTNGFEYSGDNVDVLNTTLNNSTGVNPSGEGSIGGLFSSTTFSYGLVDVTAGLRYDHYTAQGEAALAAFSGNPLGLTPDQLHVDKSEGRLNPDLTLALNPTDWFQPFISYSESFRAPTINELLAGGDHPSSSPGVVFNPNPLLDPEVARTIEIGANFKADDLFADGDSLRIKADYYRSQIDDYITAALDGADVYFVNNPGTSIVQGIELQAAYDAGVVFGGLSYTYTDSQLPSQINGFGAQSYVPEHVASLTLGTRLLDDQSLTIGGRISAVSESYIGEINAAPGDDAYDPGYTLVDLFANYQLDNGVELGLNVSNLFDVSYTPALSYTPATTGIATGRGRTIEFTAKASF